MKIHFNQYLDGGLNIELVPETVKDAANLAFLNRNADTNTRRVVGLFADSPGSNCSTPLSLTINLTVRREKHRTSKL